MNINSRTQFNKLKINKLFTCRTQNKTYFLKKGKYSLLLTQYLSNKELISQGKIT